MCFFIRHIFLSFLACSSAKAFSTFLFLLCKPKTAEQLSSFCLAHGSEHLDGSADSSVLYSTKKCTLISFTSKQNWSWSSWGNLLRISIFLSLPAVTRKIPATSSAYSGPCLVELLGKVTHENFGSLPVIHKPIAAKVIVAHSTWAKMWSWAWDVSRALEMSCYMVIQGYWRVTWFSLLASIHGCCLEVVFFFKTYTAAVWPNQRWL